MIRLVIFDWDDVFTLGSSEGYYKCYHVALEQVGVALGHAEENERIRAKWGSGHAAQLTYLLKEQPELVPRAIEVYEQAFFGETFIDCIRLVPGSQELLTHLAQTYTLAVATGGHPDILLQRVMPRFNIPDVFSQIVTIYDIDDLAHAKPHPFMVDKILQTQHVAPEDVVLVGDAENDVRMARAAGVEPIVVLTGHLNRAQAEALEVRHIIPDVTQLEAVLKLM